MVMGEFDALDQVLRQMDIEFVGRGRHKVTLEKLFATPQALLLDIRTPEEQASLPLLFPGRIPCVHIPLDMLPQRWDEIDSAAAVGVFCPHGVRAAIAYAYLRARGYANVMVVDGGYAAVTELARPGAVLQNMATRGAIPKVTP